MIKKHFSLDELFVFHYRIKFEEELNNEEDFALQSLFLYLKAQQIDRFSSA